MSLIVLLNVVKVTGLAPKSVTILYTVVGNIFFACYAMF